MATLAEPATAPGVRTLCVCPRCRGELVWTSEGGRCEPCALGYPVLDGIPVLIAGQARGQQRRQVDFFDGLEAEFEIERPFGMEAFYRRLLEEKFRRSVAGLRWLLDGATVLTVCGGSGMDAEFLARAGARVVTADLSLGAARRARERSRRHGVAIVPVVADTGRLPFPDRSFDLVYVHDGLHHLERPLAGLREMARVARLAVSVTEPARAAVTALAVRVGLSVDVEPAGNRVARLDPGDVAATLQDLGFRVTHMERYAMRYREPPGRTSRLLSTPGLLPVASAGLAVANRLVGRFGNKLTVQAVRRETAA